MFKQYTCLRLKKGFTKSLLLISLFGSSITMQSCSKKILPNVPQNAKLFKAGDRVAFVGNSITHGGRYHQYIWLYYMTRFPNLRFTIMNGGVGGDIVANINNRFDEDILTKQPNKIDLTFGMNDSGFFQYMTGDSAKISDQLFAKCDSAFKLLQAKLIQHKEIKTTLMSGSPYDFTTKVINGNGWREKPATFERIVQLQHATAAKNNWPYVDIYHPMDRLNKQYQQTDPNFTLSGSNDRVHPESYGHLVWAYLFLCNQGLKGMEVADFTVDAANAKAVTSVNCSISNVKGNAQAISFDYLANSLPFPVDEEKHNGDHHPASYALNYVPFTDDLNKEVLKVRSLDGNYELKIDDKSMGHFSAADLAKGVNVALITNTPQYQQALQILKLNEERGSVERETRDYAVQVYNFARANGIKKDNDPASWAKMRELKKTNGWINNDLYERGSNPATQKAWQDKMNNLINQIYASNKPVKHKIELVKITENQ
ncbi:SGNH/GDSL hydrolase family protein [Mucilaginibacter sp. 21P]|uniref:SGNH/GDSL hydrolase family protein n=1 Tax=Mucilaginibacter sp. 21P TaxID=2778902 RepID=UPI001C599FDE|nr:SGNH/GDSL hydrolase family protein [Mucilaginibacter sp. 21P]QXV66729.1 SGNH/GDSL hydrolase family protein [Mucilaginibacter sp. 21P]